MASTPNFASVLRSSVASVSVSNANFDGTGTIVDILTGVAAGTEITSVVVQATGNPADSMVNLWLHNGTSYFYFDYFDLGDPAAASTTVAGYRERRAYTDLWLPSSSWKLAASITVAPTSGVVNVFAFGADHT